LKKTLHKPKQARMNAGLAGWGKVAFVEQEQGAKPHVYRVFCEASQAYDEGSIPFTRSSQHALIFKFLRSQNHPAIL